MSYEFRRLRPELIDYFVVNKQTLVDELRAGEWQLLEGCSFGCEYETLEQVAEVTHERARLNSDGREEDAPTADEVRQEIERRASKMHREIAREGFYIDPEKCFIVLGPSRHAS